MHETGDPLGFAANPILRQYDAKHFINVVEPFLRETKSVTESYLDLELKMAYARVLPFDPTVEENPLNYPEAIEVTAQEIRSEARN